MRTPLSIVVAGYSSPETKREFHTTRQTSPQKARSGPYKTCPKTKIKQLRKSNLKLGCRFGLTRYRRLPLVRKTPLSKAPEFDIPQPEDQPEVPQPEFQVPNVEGIQQQANDAPEVPVDAELAADLSARMNLGTFSRLVVPNLY